ncbi:MFS transporter [Actinomadura gamaensis]|uniref:MFS transporter n=1 Tax=Actinomadura gamaensis TaxID=1763541 RepID=A0ABV9TYC2_9ACTN
MPRTVWTVLAGDAISAAGSGLTLPFLIVYLHTVRGLGVGWAGLAVSSEAASGLVGNPVGGWLSDRAGARSALVAGLAVAAAGSAALAGVRSVGTALVACGVLGLGVGVVWPAQDTLLAGLVDPSRRSGVFAVRHATMNVGLALGAAGSGLVVSFSSPAGFARLYLLDALTFLAFVPVLLSCRGLGRRRRPDERDRADPGMRRVLGDRAFRWVWVWLALVVVFGAAQFHAAFPAYATRVGGVSAAGLGVVYAVNCAAVLVVQFPVLRLMAGRRRTSGMAAVGLCWAAAWGVALAAGRSGAGTGGFGVAMAVFAVGEAFLSATVAPLVNEMAPVALRGRYNGLAALAYTVGFVVGPVLCGGMFAAGAPGTFLLVCGASLLMAALGAGWIARLPPTGSDRAAPDGSGAV